MPDPIKYYHLESYLFEDVNQRFHSDHSIGAFDFFSIISWKANRAKSKIALKLLRNDPMGRRDLEAIVRTLTSSLYNAPNHKGRMRLLVENWRFALPMASAILSVFWPDDFTIYDYRVCDQLGKFHNLRNLTNFERLWKGYLEFVAGVKAKALPGLSLRNQDRYIWGVSASGQLQADIQKLFQPEVDKKSTAVSED